MCRPMMVSEVPASECQVRGSCDPEITAATEGDILHYVFFHSLALTVLVGLLIMAQAYVWPFTLLVY